MPKKTTEEATPVSGEVQKLFDGAADEKGIEEATTAVLSVEDLQVIDQTLIADALAMVGDLYEPEVCYNYPKKTDGGPKSMKACDRMRNGCPYKGKFNHIHVVDVGIRGARIAAQAYGGLDYKALAMPVITEQAGRMYWVVEVMCRDEIRNLTVGQWQFQPLLVKGKGGLYDEIEHGAAIVQSKGLRNVILSVIPPQLRRMWKQDYLDGREAFDPERIAALPGGRKGLTNGGRQRSLPAADKPKDKPKGKSKTEDKDKPKGKSTKTPNSAGMDLDTTIKAFAEKLGEKNVKLVEDWSSQFETPGLAMLELTRALDPKKEDVYAKYRQQYHDWKEKQPAEGEQEEMDM